jgi:hypothetical protein
MAYTTGGTIEAWDYNRLTWGGNTQVYSAAAPNLSRVWGTGFGIIGYGQDATAMSTVSSGGTVTATQWSTFIQRLNLALAHQSGAGAQLASGSNIGVVAGATIQAFANANIAVETVTTNANLWSAQGSTTVGTPIYQTLSVGNFAAYTLVWNRTITFASGDAARYFFNAGGQINWAFVAYNLNGTTRSGTAVTLFATNLGGGNIRGVNGTAITGAGGTVGTNTGRGYWQLTSSVQLAASITSATATYGGTVANINIRTNGVQGANGDVGSVITLQLGFTSAQEGGDFNSAISANIGLRVDVISPETTYLASYALPTIA